MDSPIWRQMLAPAMLQASAERPVYVQLADLLLVLIKNGSLAYNQKLPSTRDLAAHLQINRITVGKAYDELQMQGWLRGAVGRGTFVSANVAEHQSKAITDSRVQNAMKTAGFAIATRDYPEIVGGTITTELHLDDGFPDPRLAPLKELYRAYRSQLTRSGLYEKFGGYGHPAGPDKYRTSLSGYLNATRNLRTTAQNIMSVRGTLMGLNLVCRALIKPGDVVVSGIPGWRRAEHSFQQAQAKHIGIPVDEHGLVVDELKKICKRHTVRMVYVTPHHHYPTTVSLPIDRRLELLRLASAYGFIIFEDDYDFDFHYTHRPLLPLASADESGMVIYCGSFSKSFSPAFRMGYLVAAENVIEHLTRARVLFDRQGDHMLDNAMAELLNDGTIQRYLRKALTVYEERRDYFCDLMHEELRESVTFAVPEGGMTVWTQFDQSINLETLAQSAYRMGLFVSDGRNHQYKNYDANAVRLGFASSSTDELARCVEVLRRAIRRGL